MSKFFAVALATLIVGSSFAEAKKVETKTVKTQKIELRSILKIEADIVKNDQELKDLNKTFMFCLRVAEKMGEDKTSAIIKPTKNNVLDDLISEAKAKQKVLEAELFSANKAKFVAAEKAKKDRKAKLIAKALVDAVQAAEAKKVVVKKTPAKKVVVKKTPTKKVSAKDAKIAKLEAELALLKK